MYARMFKCTHQNTWDRTIYVTLKRFQYINNTMTTFRIQIDLASTNRISAVQMGSGFNLQDMYLAIYTASFKS